MGSEPPSSVRNPTGWLGIDLLDYSTWVGSFRIIASNHQATEVLNTAHMILSRTVLMSYMDFNRIYPSTMKKKCHDLSISTGDFISEYPLVNMQNYMENHHFVTGK